MGLAFWNGRVLLSEHARSTWDDWVSGGTGVLSARYLMHAIADSRQELLVMEEQVATPVWATQERAERTVHDGCVGQPFDCDGGGQWSMCFRPGKICVH